MAHDSKATAATVQTMMASSPKASDFLDVLMAWE